MFLNTEVIHSEPQRHFSGTRPRQTPHPPLSIPLSTGGEPAQGRHQLSSPQGLHYMQPLTATTFSKPKARSKVNDKCCSVKANLLCKTCLSLSGILNYFFLSIRHTAKKQPCLTVGVGGVGLQYTAFYVYSYIPDWLFILLSCSIVPCPFTTGLGAWKGIF